MGKKKLIGVAALVLVGVLVFGHSTYQSLEQIRQEKKDQKALTEAVALREKKEKEEADALKAREVTLTQAKLDGIITSLKGYTNITLVQSMKNLNPKGEVETGLKYTLDVDLKQKIVLTQIDTTVEKETTTTSYASDYVRDLHYKYIENDGTWGYAEDKTISLSKNLISSLDVSTFYRALTEGLALPIDTKGYKDVEGGATETYSMIVPATKDSIAGVTYDKLGDERVSLKIYISEEGKTVPVSITTEVDYIVGGKTHTCKSEIEILDYSNDKLELPAMSSKSREIELPTETVEENVK